MSDSCVFCEIVAGRAPAKLVYGWLDAVAFVPLNLVTEGHVLVVPRIHVDDALVDPLVTAMVFARASQLAAKRGQQCNLLTSVGENATQSIFHLHAHYVPRLKGDGLALPWTGQERAER